MMSKPLCVRAFLEEMSLWQQRSRDGINFTYSPFEASFLENDARLFSLCGRELERLEILFRDFSELKRELRGPKIVVMRAGDEFTHEFMEIVRDHHESVLSLLYNLRWESAPEDVVARLNSLQTELEDLNIRLYRLWIVRQNDYLR